MPVINVTVEDSRTQLQLKLIIHVQWDIVWQRGISWGLSSSQCSCRIVIMWQPTLNPGWPSKAAELIGKHSLITFSDAMRLGFSMHCRETWNGFEIESSAKSVTPNQTRWQQLQCPQWTTPWLVSICNWKDMSQIPATGGLSKQPSVIRLCHSTCVSTRNAVFVSRLSA